MTSLILALLTLLALAAWCMSILRLRRTAAAERPNLTAGWAQHLLLLIILLGAAGLFVARWLWVHGDWQPLSAHVDGLLLLGALLAGAVLFIQSRVRLFGLSVFMLPVLALLLAWGVCAALWTYRLFDMQTLHPVWQGVHLGTIYLGTLFAIVAATAGAMYLYVRRQLKGKRHLARFGRLASLETLEGVIVRTAVLGFLLLTLGLVSGLVILIDEPQGLAAVNWAGYAPKLVLATLAWLSYALLMNVRFASGFRGPRAAWLAIVGLALLLATYALVTAGGGEEEVAEWPSGQVAKGRKATEGPSHQAIKCPDSAGDLGGSVARCLGGFSPFGYLPRKEAC